MRFFVLFYSLFHFITSHAADINLGITQISKDNRVNIIVNNMSRQTAAIERLELTLNKKSYVINKVGTVLAGQEKHYSFVVQMPDTPGSYAQQINLYYINNSELFTLTDIGFFNYIKPFNLQTPDKLYSYDTQPGKLSLKSTHPDKWRLVLPQEVTSRRLQTTTDKIRNFQIKGNYSGFNNNYPVFAVTEGIKNNRHYAQILRAKLQVIHNQKIHQRGRTSSRLLLAFVILSLGFFVLAHYRSIVTSRYYNFIHLYGARLFWLSLSYYLLKNSPLIIIGSAAFLEQFAWFSKQGIYFTNSLHTFGNYLNGNNFDYFFRYFIDFYFWGFVILYPFYLLFFKPLHYVEEQVDRDKYIACLQWTIRPIYSLLSCLKIFSYTKNFSEKHELQSPVKKGFLIIAVKLFFLPLLASWVIGNVIHQWNLTQSFEWSFHHINGFILALLILTDTSIFLAGYMFESHYANNQIRSVEPTLFGWIVCLWCYPPFNSFSFAIFDYNLLPIHIGLQAWAVPVVLTSITLLWVIFVWASITLGLKASNLTNRGTVSTGPYRYCRHPAYTAKVMIWAVEAVFLGKYFIGLLIGFSIIYFLRAWTEERHMSLDEEYRIYKQRVPYRFIPGVI